MRALFSEVCEKLVQGKCCQSRWWKRVSKIHTYWRKLIDLFPKHAVEYKYSGFPKMMWCLAGSWTKQVPSKNPRCPSPKGTLNVTKMTHGCRSIPWGTHKMVQMRTFKWKDILRTQCISQTASHPPHPSQTASYGKD